MLMKSRKQLLRASALVLATTPYCWSKADSIDGAPFAGVNESLMRTADAVLSSPDLQRPNAVAQGTSGVLAGRSVNSANGSNNSVQPMNSARAIGRLESLRPAIEPILRKAGLPADLTAVILVESGGNAAAVSLMAKMNAISFTASDNARQYVSAVHVYALATE